MKNSKIILSLILCLCNIQLFAQQDNAAEQIKICKDLLKSTEKHTISRYKEGKVKTKLDNLSVKDNTFYCRLSVQNKSNIDYDVDFIRFYLKDLKVAKRTVVQEIEINPSLSLGDDQQPIKKGENKVYVFAIPKFSFTKDQVLLIEVYEKNGGRHLNLHIPYSKIIKAKSIHY